MCVRVLGEERYKSKSLKSGPGDGWAPLGEILPELNPMIPLDRIGRRSG